MAPDILRADPPGARNRAGCSVALGAEPRGRDHARGSTRPTSRSR